MSPQVSMRSSRTLLDPADPDQRLDWTAGLWSGLSPSLHHTGSLCMLFTLPAGACCHGVLLLCYQVVFFDSL